MTLIPTRLRTPASARLALLLFAAGISPAAAQPAGGPPQGWVQRAHAGVVYQTDADLERGGSFSVGRFFLGADFLRFVDKETTLGFSLGAGWDAYDFSEVVAPWGDVTTLNASFTYAKDLSADWALRLMPTIQSSFEDGASMSDGVVVGLIGAATHTFNPDLSLGLGAAVFTGLEETRAFPFLAINWKISETWTLQNPFRPGPAGPAGIELARKGDAWDFGFGGAYRSYRFRLDDRGEVNGGIGEYNGVPLFVRATRKFDKNWELDLYAGMIVGGGLELEDDSGRGLAESDFDPAPLAAVTLTGRF
jgi:hypothetical protein